MPPPDKFSPGAGGRPSSYSVTSREVPPDELPPPYDVTSRDVPLDSELEPEGDVSSRGYDEGLPIDYYTAESFMRQMGMPGLMGDVAGMEVTGADLLQNMSLGDQGQMLAMKNAGHELGGPMPDMDAVPPWETGPAEDVAPPQEMGMLGDEEAADELDAMQEEDAPKKRKKGGKKKSAKKRRRIGHAGHGHEI
jgi:hypothetical protein